MSASKTNSTSQVVVLDEFIVEFRRRFEGKSWVEIEWELEEEEEEEQRRIDEMNRLKDAERKKEWDNKKYDLEEGEIFE